MRNFLLICIAGLMMLALPLTACAGDWTADREIDCRDRRPNCLLLQVVMMGSFDAWDGEDSLTGRVFSAACPQLCAITQEDIAHFADEFGQDAAAVRIKWYQALGVSLRALILTEEIREGGMDPAQRVLLLFLDPRSEPDARAQMAQIRGAMTDEVLERISEGTGAPVEFVRWAVWQEDAGS